MLRVALLLFFCAAPSAADERLGTLIRWYLAEERPARQLDIVEKIRALAGNDVERVARAIRTGAHFRFDAEPRFGSDAPAPVFSPQRFRTQPVAGAAGRFAELSLPEGYRASAPHALVLDLGRGTLPAPRGAVRVVVDVAAHAQAARSALAAEALVLSILARTCDLVNVDAERVFLRAQGDDYVSLGIYVALHNPDRFAGLLTAQGSWADAERLAPNARYFSILAIESRRGDADLQRFMSLDARFDEIHRLVRAPANPRDDEKLLPVIHDWHRRRSRQIDPNEVRLVADRNTRVRAFWLRAAPRYRSPRKGVVGRRWKHSFMANPPSVSARFDENDKNLVHVTADRISAFWLYVAPGRCDLERPLRVAINGGIPEAKLLDPQIEVMLEDYKERRDPGLLYACRLAYTVR